MLKFFIFLTCIAFTMAITSCNDSDNNCAVIGEYKTAANTDCLSTIKMIFNNDGTGYRFSSTCDNYCADSLNLEYVYEGPFTYETKENNRILVTFQETKQCGIIFSTSSAQSEGQLYCDDQRLVFGAYVIYKQ